MHLALKDPAAFRAFIDDAEKRGGVTAETASYQGVNYRRYPLEMDGKPNAGVASGCGCRETGHRYPGPCATSAIRCCRWR